jgi:hypothetical protein
MPGPLTYQEILRTLGTLLDHAGAKTATILLAAEGAQVSAPGWPWPRAWDLEALQAQTAAQRSLRLNPRARRIPRPGRTSKRLRVVGAALDLENSGPYTITLAPDVIQIESRNGQQRTFESRPLARRPRLAPHLRGQLPTAAPTQAPAPSIARGGLLSP